LPLPEIKERTSIVGLIFDAILALVTFAITTLTIYPMFTGDFTQNWGSIESAFLSDAVFVANNYPHLGWYPYWYGGLPFHISYVPLLPYMVAGLHFLMGWNIGHSYRVITGVAYAATPAALYALTRSISKSRVAALIAALSYSLVPTFLQGLVPSHIETLAVYGEGPHLLALPFVLLATAQLLRCMKRSTMLGYLSTAILVAVVALTNLIALYAFALFALLALAAEIVYGQPGQAFRVFFLSALLSYGLVAFQYDLQFIRASASAGAGGGGSFVEIWSSPWLPAIFALMISVPGFMLMIRSFVKAGLKNTTFLALVWVAVFGTIVLARLLFDLVLAPQPIRYAPELDLSVALLVGVVAAGVVELVTKLRPNSSNSFSYIAKTGMTALVVAVLIFNSTTALLPISTQVAIHATSIADVPEYRIAEWLSAHVADERVYATGTPAFWLNVFSNVQQIRGGAEGVATNSWWASAAYQINEGSNPRLSIMWAEVWNVKYIVVTFPNASTAYHDYVYPEKFNGILPLRYYYRGFGVYEVPLPELALVQAVSAQSARSLRPISNASDVNALSDYMALVAAIVPATRVSYTRPTPDELSISVSNALTDTAILVKMTYDPSWQARLENRDPVPLSQIGPDFIAAYPKKSGNYRLDLRFNRPTGELLGFFITVTTLFLVVLMKPIIRLFRFRERKVTNIH